MNKYNYINALQCDKRLWLDKYEPDLKNKEHNSPKFMITQQVKEQATKLFRNRTSIENGQDKRDITKKLLKKRIEVIQNAAFSHEDNYCSIDIIVNNKGFLDIYEIKSEFKVKDFFIDELAYQLHILTSLGYVVNKVYLIHLNKDYIKKHKLDLTKLFIIRDYTKKAYAKQKEVLYNLNYFNSIIKNIKEPDIDIDYHCRKYNSCPYFEYCTQGLSKPNVFDLHKNLPFEYMINLYKQGYIDYKQLLNSKIKPVFKQQIDHTLNKRKPFIDKDKLNNFLSQIWYPIYYLDFETLGHIIPIYHKTYSWQNIPYLYSLHYQENKDSEVKHKYFLADHQKDPRYDLAYNLINDIPETACIIAYNIRYEKEVIKELAEYLPEFAPQLMKLYNNFIDLLEPFMRRYYYQHEFAGSFSLKDVLPAMFKNHHNLKHDNLGLIQRGWQANNLYLELDTMNEEKRNKAKEAMIAYCTLDTYALVKILNKLMEVNENI